MRLLLCEPAQPCFLMLSHATQSAAALFSVFYLRAPSIYNAYHKMGKQWAKLKLFKPNFIEILFS